MPRKIKPTAPNTDAVSKGEATRAKLIAAAYQQFLQRGFHGASMRQIAEAANIAVGGIYNHFANKEDVFAAVLDAYHPYHIVLPALEAIEADSAEDFLRQTAQRLYEGMTQAKAQLLPLIFIELVEFQGRHLKQLIEKLLPTILDFVQRLTQKRGPLRPIPPPVMFRTFMGMLAGYFLSDMLLRDTPLFRQRGVDWYGGMIDIYLHGILASEA
jgi:AcrR family transcriptional regulator